MKKKAEPPVWVCALNQFLHPDHPPPSFSPLLIPSHQQVFHRWGRWWWPCRGWPWDRPPAPAPCRHKIPNRWALRATISGWCWWRVTSPPSPSMTRWSSSTQPREITSAGVRPEKHSTEFIQFIVAVWECDFILKALTNVLYRYYSRLITILDLL